MRLSILLGLLLLASAPAAAQTPAPPDPDVERAHVFDSYAAFREALDAAAGDLAAMDALWQRLEEAHQIPFAHGDSMAFLYRGAAEAVDWRGDFNSWGNAGPLGGERVGESDVWIGETTFPAAARLDYKVVVDGQDWRLDPHNPLVAWSGFGPNSELRMPAYRYPLATVRKAGVPAGTRSEWTTITSARLGYDVAYQVYTPHGYEHMDDLPVLYVTDGHEYGADHLGSLPVILDNLLAAGEIEPVMAVFVDPREVGSPGNNRRADQYLANPDFAAFFADELIPAVDAAYATAARAEGRGILGTSYGGVNAAWFGAARPDVFGKVAIQSPAFQAWRDVYDVYREEADTTLQVFVDHGLVRDGDGGPRLRRILEARGFDHRYVEMAEGHAWAHWRAVLDDILRFFWGTDTTIG